MALFFILSFIFRCIQLYIFFTEFAVNIPGYINGKELVWTINAK